MPDDRLDRIKVDTFRSSLPLCSGNPAAPDSARDRDALVALYESTNGQGWTNRTNWLSDRPLGEWYGVTTDRQGRVIQLEIIPEEFQGLRARLNLIGELPEEIGNLDKLLLLVIVGTFRDEPLGEIPASIGKLEELQVMVLQGLQLSGDIPDLEELVHLRELDLSGNNLSGEIPDSLRHLRDLEDVNLGNNGLGSEQSGLSGPIPTWIGQLSSLNRVHLSSNKLVGPIPAALGNLPDLEVLYLGNNQLSGCVPEALRAVNDLSRLPLPWCGE